MSTNVPSLQFSDTGVSIPTEAEILAGELADIDAAFGGGVNPSLTTPQGQLATSITAIIGDKNDQIAHIVNQVDPDYADGVFQDAIGRIYFLERKPAAPTAVTCQCGGSAGVILPAGARAQDQNGNLYLCADGGTIGESGTVDLSFVAEKTGPIACPAGTLTKIYQTIPGWDTITNAAAGVPGTNAEGRAEFEARRRNSVAINARGTKESIYANVFNVDGVIDVFVIDNPKKIAVKIGATDYSLEANSVYVAVVGGEDFDVAFAIYEKLDLGCDTVGNTTALIQDRELYDFPYPTYTINFNRPTELPIKFAIEIVNDPALPSDIIPLVKAAVLNAFVGSDGGKRPRIAASIFSSRFYAPVIAVSDFVSIISILIGVDVPTLNSVSVGIDECPVISEDDISVFLI